MISFLLKVFDYKDNSQYLPHEERVNIGSILLMMSSTEKSQKHAGVSRQ